MSWSKRANLPPGLSTRAISCTSGNGSATWLRVVMATARSKFATEKGKLSPRARS